MLDAWQKVRRPPPAIEDFRGGLCLKRKDYQNAERHWLAFLATKPRAADAATEYDNLANLCVTQARWADNAAYRTKAIAAEDSAARRVFRACVFMRLHEWDAAYADMAKANKIDNQRIVFERDRADGRFRELVFAGWKTVAAERICELVRQCEQHAWRARAA